MLKTLFRRKQNDTSASKRAMAYEEQRTNVQKDDVDERLLLASQRDTKPEILYYLADDDAADVRRAVAGNETTPPQADVLLAKDVDDDVRCSLARKITRLLPDMTDEERDRVSEMTLEVLDMLADDQLPRVRAILAEELKHSEAAPLHIVRRLARDIELIVSAPILEYSPLLNDTDLTEIIAAGTAQGALSAIARRANLSAEVSDNVVATLDVPAVASLLANESAQIREETLDNIIDNANGVEDWHQPLVMRPELSVRAMRRIAGFVASALVNVLVEQHKLDSEVGDELLAAARQRIAGGEVSEDDDMQAARSLIDRGALDDEALCDAIKAGKRNFVLHALSLQSDLAMETINRIFRSGNPKAITALSWKAGYNMRTAIQLQSRTGHLPPSRLLNARNGVDYPMNEPDMEWQLEVFA